MYKYSLFFLLVLVTNLHAQEFDVRFFAEVQAGITATNLTASELDANSLTDSGFGLAFLLEKPLSSKLRFSGGIGLDILQTAVEVTDQIPSFREDPEFFPLNAEASATLTYLNIPLMIDYQFSASSTGLFFRLRSDALFHLGDSSNLEYTAGGRPRGARTSSPGPVEAPSFTHFIGVGLGYDFALARSGRILRIQPYYRFSTLSVLDDPKVLQVSGQQNYLRESRISQYGILLSCSL